MMKITITTGCRSLALFCLGLLTVNSNSAWAQGTVVPHSIAFGQPGGGPPGTYLMANAYPGGENAGFFVLSLTTISTGNYQLGYFGIAELYSVHAASFGVAFTPNYVAGDTPLLNNNNTPGTHQFSLGLGQSKFFAYWDDAQYLFGNPPPPGAVPNAPDLYDAYGWFQLTRLASGLTISDSATAMGNGIFVGTYASVPEPACGVFGILALLGLVSRHKR